jgi:hypothetical protein
MYTSCIPISLFNHTSSYDINIIRFDICSNFCSYEIAMLVSNGMTGDGTSSKKITPLVPFVLMSTSNGFFCGLRIMQHQILDCNFGQLIRTVDLL